MTAINKYAIEYIRAAVNGAQLTHPEAAQAGKDLETLLAIYEAWRIGGTRGAQGAWSALKKVAPHLDRRERRKTADELEDIYIPEYGIEGYPVYDVGLNLLIGTRGAGKTFVALDIACRFAVKHPTRCVIYAVGEAMGAFSPRFKAWVKHYNAHPKNIIFWEGAVKALDPLDVAEFKSDFKDDKPVFMVIDTVARSMAGLNENDTAVMSKYADAIEELGKEMGCGILLVHHEGRNGMQRGSSVLDANMDSVIAVKRHEKTIMLHNDLENGGKNRHNEEPNPQALEFLPVEIMVKDKPKTSGVLVPQAEPDPADAEQQYTPKQLAIFEVIEAHGELAPADLIAATGISKTTFYRHLTPLIKKNVIALDKHSGMYKLAESHSAQKVGLWDSHSHKGS